MPMLLTLALKTFGSGIIEKLLGYLQQRANVQLEERKAEVGADTQLALAQLTAEVEARKLQTQIALADAGWWVTRWMRPLAFYLCLMHFGAIVLDSTFRLHWGVPALPPPYDGFEQAILLSIIIARPFEKIGRVFAARK